MPLSRGAISMPDDDTPARPLLPESSSDYDSPEDYPKGFQWSGADPDAPDAPWTPEPDASEGQEADAEATDEDTGEEPALPPEEELWGEPEHITFCLGIGGAVQRLPGAEVELVHDPPNCRYFVRSEDAADPTDREEWVDGSAGARTDVRPRSGA